MKIQREYTGRLKAGDTLQFRQDGAIVLVREIVKHNGVWCAELSQQKLNESQSTVFMHNAYDLETDIYLNQKWEIIKS
jgi:hypothetical protein